MKAENEQFNLLDKVHRTAEPQTSLNSCMTFILTCACNLNQHAQELSELRLGIEQVTERELDMAKRLEDFIIQSQDQNAVLQAEVQELRNLLAVREEQLASATFRCVCGPLTFCWDDGGYEKLLRELSGQLNMKLSLTSTL